jgi:hypothetical protein
MPVRYPGQSSNVPTQGELATAKGSRIGGVGAPQFTNYPPPLSLPMIAPGRFAQIGKEFSAGHIASLDQYNPSPYFYTIHYFPSDIATSASSNYDAAVLAPSDSSHVNSLASGGGFGFSLFLNREMEVSSHTQSTAPGPNGDTSFDQMGTMYDVEILFRTFNGAPGQNANPQFTPYLSSAMYLNLLLPTFCSVFISPVLQFVGRPVSVDVNHLKYNSEMIPMLSTVTLAFASTSRGGPADAVAGAVTSEPSGTAASASGQPGGGGYGSPASGSSGPF